MDSPDYSWYYWVMKITATVSIEWPTLYVIYERQCIDTTSFSNFFKYLYLQMPYVYQGEHTGRNYGRNFKQLLNSQTWLRNVQENSLSAITQLSLEETWAFHTQYGHCKSPIWSLTTHIYFPINSDNSQLSLYRVGKRNLEWPLRNCKSKTDEPIVLKLFVQQKMVISQRISSILQ